MARNNFYFLFAGLLILLGIAPLLDGAPNSRALIQLAFTAMIVVGAFDLVDDGRWFYLGLALAGAGLASGLGFYHTGFALLGVIDLLAILGFCLLAVAIKLRRVLLSSGAITLNRVVGALCLYLLLGVIWAIMFEFVELARPGAFDYHGQQVGEPIEQMLYYSFVTLTTLGYGDIAPIDPVARTLSYLEAVIGHLYVAVLVAGLVGRRVSERVGVSTSVDVASDLQ